jgi:hypothetical protein
LACTPSPAADAVVRDRIQIIFTDILVELEDTAACESLIEELALLRSDLKWILYEEEEIWITLSSIGIIRE